MKLRDYIKGRSKEQAEQLCGSEKRYRLLFENMLEGYAWCRMLFEHGRPHDFIYLDVNPAFEKLTGLKNVVGEKVTDVIPGIRESLPELFVIYGRVALTGKPERFEVHSDRFGGWLSISVYSFEKECFVAVFENVTEHKLFDERLRESESKYRNLVDNALVGVYRSNLAGKFLYVNDAMARMFECGSAAEMLDEDVFRRYRNRQDREAYIQELKLHGRVSNYELEVPTKSGRSLHVLLSAVLEGDVISGTVLDISDKKKLERQLQQAQKMEAVGQLTAGIAHDFNNILSAVTGYGSLLKSGMDQNDPLRSHIDQILASANKAATLTRSLLTFSRQQRTNLMPIDVNETIGKVESLLGRTIGEDVDFTTVPARGALTVNADPGQVEQALMNLAMNARDAMPNGGRLTIETRKVRLDDEFSRMHEYGKPGEYALIAVTDTGIGMDEQTRRRIFEPFFTTKEPGKGTGLGLSMVYGIVKKHDGFINVYSEPGKGTTFKIYLPLTDLPAQKAEHRPERDKDEPVVGGAETLMVAEDDEALRKLNTIILRRLGYCVIEAVDGQEAVEKFIEQKERIKLLVLDGIMPRKSGKDAYREIAAVEPGIKAIIMSGYAESILADREMREKGVVFSMKPVMPKELARSVRELLDRPAGDGKCRV